MTVCSRHLLGVVVVMLCLLVGCISGPPSNGGKRSDGHVTYKVSLVLPQSWMADSVGISWSLQVDAALQMALASINARLQKDKARWRMEAMAFYPQHKFVGRDKEFHSHAETLFFRTLEVLQDESLVSLITIGSVAATRTVALLAGQVARPVITTNMDSLLHTSSVSFPTLLRVSQADTWLHLAVRDLLLAMNWLRVAVFQHPGSTGQQAFSDQLQSSSKGQISVEAVVTPVLNADVLSEHTRHAVQLLRLRNVSIFVTRTDPVSLALLLEYAQELGMVGVEKNNAWVVADLGIAPKQIPTRLWHLLDGTLFIRPAVDLDRFRQFSRELKQWMGTGVDKHEDMTKSSLASEISIHAAYAYDAANAIAAGIAAWRQDSTAGQHQQGQLSGSTSRAHNTTDPRNLRPSVAPVAILRPLKYGTELLASVKKQLVANSSTVSPILPYSDYDNYNFFVVDNQTHLVPLGSWRGDTLSLLDIGETATVADVYWESLRAVWKWRFPADIPIHTNLIRVLVVAYRPLIFLKSGATDVQTLSSYDGPLVPLWRNLSLWFNLNYTITLWNGTSINMLLDNGCHKPAAERTWDIILGGIGASAFSRKVLDCHFSTTIASHAMRITFKQPQPTRPILWKFFLKPFSLELWLTFAATMVLAAVVLLLLDQEGMATARRGNIVMDALFFSFSAFLGFGEHRIRKVWARLFILCFQFLILVVIALYTAAMAKHLTEGDKSPDSFMSGGESPLAPTDLANIKVGYRPGSEPGEFVSGLLGSNHRALQAVTDYSSAVQRLEQGELGAIFSSGLAAMAITAGNCHLASRRVKSIQRISLVYAEDREWGHVIDHALNLPEVRRGIADALLVQLRSTCDSEDLSGSGEEKQQAGTGNMVSGQMGSLLVVVAVASVMAMAAKTYYYCRHGRRKRQQLAWQHGLLDVAAEDPWSAEHSNGVTGADALSYATAYDHWAPATITTATTTTVSLDSV